MSKILAGSWGETSQHVMEGIISSQPSTVHMNRLNSQTPALSSRCRAFEKIVIPTLTLALLASPAAYAANAAWDTDAASGNFNTAQWTSGTTTPGAGGTYTVVSGDALYFGTQTTGATTLTNDLTSATFAGITFNSGASAFTIGGNAFTLSGALTNNSSNLQTFSNAITAAAAQTITGAGDIALSGNLSGAGTSLTKSGTGTLSLSGTNSPTGTIQLSAGSLNITGGTTNFGGAFSSLSNTASTTAVVNVSSGATFGLTGNNGGNFASASGASMALYNSGAFNQSATTANNAGIYLGNAANSYGYLRTSSGATTTVAGRLWVTRGQNVAGATGVLDIAGGAVSVNPTATFTNTQRFQINVDNTNHTTSTAYAGVNITNGGTLAIGGNAQTQVNSNTGSYASINITGSGSKWTTGTSGNDTGIGLGQTSSALNTATLSISNGGTLETAYIYNNNTAGTGVINIDNGTVRSIFNNSTGIIQGTNTKTYIQSGGATFDTNGFATTVQNPLLAPSGSGIDTITLGGTLTGYVGAPVVVISGGGGTGAAAVANFDPTTGTITSITVTGKGSGYTSAPTITLVGGNGGSTGAGTGTATATATTGSVTSGGLTKTGTGTLTLSGANTYTGTTTVSQGTLKVASGGALNSSSAITVANGATLENANGASITPALTLSEGAALTTSAASSSFAPTSLTLTGNLSDGWTAIALTASAGSGLTKSGALTLTLSGITVGTYNLTSGSGFTGSFSSANINGSALSASGSDWTGTVGGFDYTYTNTTNVLSITAVPEPHEFALAIVSLLGVMIFIRRRQASRRG
jgi:autotransporter-associated beta strand protein